jgi:hypothetical protein
MLLRVITGALPSSTEGVLKSVKTEENCDAARNVGSDADWKRLDG